MRKNEWQPERVERKRITKRDWTERSTLRTRRVIIADDFTGACDVGIQFAKHGISTSVIFRKPSTQELKAAGLVVYDTETRNEFEKEAYRRVLSFCSVCQKAGVDLAYKKIDSTLRGNLGAELQAILDRFRESFVLICPTYPEYKRTVVDGHLLVNGVPVDKTEFAKDPSNPVRSSDIRTLVMSQTSESVGGIQLATVRKGSHKVSWAIRQLAERGIRVIWADAENRNDLKSVASACFQSNLIPCGSAGLAEEIARILQSLRPKIMILSATTNEATLNELQRMARYPRVFLLKARVDALAGESRSLEISRIHMLTTRAVEKYDVILVCSALYAKDIQPKFAHSERGGRSDAVASGLAAATASLALSGALSATLLTGGDMAAAFLRKIRARGLRLEREILPGIPLGRVISGKAAGLKVVTKAGGFGLQGSMRQIVDSLTYGGSS
jgi:uncharacterized protein YgbK (DUF1537 family)